MKTNVLPIIAGALGSLALAVSASGQFLGASIEEIDLGAPEGFVTYRVVAHLADKDLMLAWGALPDVAELHFFTGNGVNLLNAGGEFDGLKAEDFPGYPFSEMYDSWLTFGTTEWVRNGPDYPKGFIGSDGVHAAVVGNSFQEDAGLIFNSNPKSPWFGPDVVIAQFTLPEGNGFHFEGMVGWALAGVGAGFESSPFVVDNITTLCPWDLDGTGSVGAADLLSLLVNWGPCKGCPADFDGDGNVGASDLLALLANWGPCP